MISSEESNLLKKYLPNDDVLTQCMHCGMCLAVCPTYELTKLERSSPRGRIRLIKSIAEGTLPISSIFVDEMNFCLDCQACETACPAGVKYGKMVESARAVVSQTSFGKTFSGMIKKVLLNKVVADHRKLKLAAKVFSFYQRSFVRRFLVFILSLSKRFARLKEIESLIPEISSFFSSEMLAERESHPKAKYKVAFLTGCIMDVAFAEINKDTVDVLKEVGCEIITPQNQACCGSLHAHNGEMERGLSLAKKNIDVFSSYTYDFLVSNSAGCGAFMKEYGDFFEHDPEYAEKAKIFSSKVKDISEFLAGIDFEQKLHPINELVTYHDACHLCHSQKVTEQPRNVLAKIPEIELKALDESTWCCGSAGIYNVVRHDDAEKILERKLDNLEKTGAKIVVTGNPGCIGQLKYGIKKRGMEMKVMHTVSLVKKSMLDNK